MGADHLLHECRRCEPQAEDRNAQCHVLLDRQLVLTEEVVDGLDCLEVVTSVDLDDEPDVLPGDIEVAAATRQLTDYLAIGLSEVDRPAEGGKIKLAWRSDGRTNRCCTTRQRTSAACRSERAQLAACTAAASGRTRGTPAPTTGGMRRRRCRTTPSTS